MNGFLAPVSFFHPANAVTYFSLVFGLIAMNSPRPGLWLALCVLCDVLDGRFARLFRRNEKQAAFGVQLDSLVDAIVFGVVPWMSVVKTLPADAPPYLFAASIAVGGFYAICAVTRLGFYNVFQAETKDFVGVPTTLAGFFWAVGLLFGPQSVHGLFVLVGLGAVMVLPLRIPRPGPVGMIVLILLTLATIIAHLLRSAGMGLPWLS